MALQKLAVISIYPNYTMKTMHCANSPQGPTPYTFHGVIQYLEDAAKYKHGQWTDKALIDN